MQNSSKLTRHAFEDISSISPDFNKPRNGGRRNFSALPKAETNNIKKFASSKTTKRHKFFNLPEKVCFPFVFTANCCGCRMLKGGLHEIRIVINHAVYGSIKARRA